MKKIKINNPMDKAELLFEAEGIVFAKRVGVKQYLVIINAELYEKYKHETRKPHH